MPQVKNALLRYRIINSCFTNKQKPYWTYAEIIERLRQHDIDIVKRTLEDDFAAMRFDKRLGFHAPIFFCKENKAFHYEDPNFTIDNMPLTEEDLQALTLATNILHQYKNAKLVQLFEGLVDKLSKIVNHLRKPQNSKLIAFEHAPYYKGDVFYDAIVNALFNQECLRIVYRKFTRDKNDEHILHPYYLKEYGGRWYVLGYTNTHNIILMFALDRFVKVDPATDTFIENKTFKPKKHFQNALGVTVTKGPVEDIELWFSPIMAPYVKTLHLHTSQKTMHEDEKGLVINLKLVQNPELIEKILGYGANVKVLKPESLRLKMKDALDRARQLYDE